jgi:hypothetical protein
MPLASRSYGADQGCFYPKERLVLNPSISIFNAGLGDR